MTRQEVDATLKAYRHEYGRCGHLAAQIQQIEREIKAEQASYAEQLVSVGGQNLTGMPRGTAISDPTGKIGLKLAEGWKSEYMVELEARWSRLQAEYAQVEIKVRFVMAWLSGLSERERYVIEQQVIDGITWREVANGYRERYGYDVSKDTLKRIRNTAMDKIYVIAS